MPGKLITSTLFVLLSLTQFATAGKIAFKPAQSYPVGTNPIWVVAGDFNNDGRRDLAVINQGDASVGDPGGVSILFGNGDGTFQPAKNLTIGKNCTSAVAGDFDGDGNMDLALLRPGDSTVNDDGGVTIFLGNGDGTFHQGTVLTPGKNPSGLRYSIAAADLNGDQRLDLVVANGGDKTFSVMLGNGDGTFQPPVAYPVINSPGSVLVVDLAGNGTKDMAVFRGIGVDIWLGNGDGTFRQSPIPSILGSGVTVGDFNGDNTIDLVVTPFVLCLFHTCPPVNPVLSLGHGDGTFASGIDIGHPVQEAGDFDGDGKLDLAGLLANNGSLELQILPGNGDGTFQPPIAIAINESLLYDRVLDVNGDGAPDLVLIGQSNIELLINVGTDFSLSASALSPSTLSPGQSATSTISLGLLSAFNNPVSLACSVQPAQARGPTCSLSSNSVTFDANGEASATLTISTGSSAASVDDYRPFSKTSSLWLPVAGFAFLATGFGVGTSRRRHFVVLPIGAVLFIGLILQTACGGRSSGFPKSTAYTVTITGTAAAMQHSTTVSLTLQ
ncbi:MAG: FG-GAP repeat domain-containing protein [Candidatus Sulfotelmatobacter sp.]